MNNQMNFSNASVPVASVLNSINTVKFGGLDLQPSYQRGYVWKDDFKDKLIYSIIKSYPTGNISIRVLKDANAKGAKSEVVDGQQRLTTFCLFYLALYHLSLQRSQPDDLDVANTLQDKILFDNSEIGRNLNKSRFELTPNDQMSLDKLFNGDDNEFDQDSRLTVNYKKFLSLMKEMQI